MQVETTQSVDGAKVTDRYAHVNSTSILVRDCITNRKNVSLNSNACKKQERLEASLATTQVTRRACSMELITDWNDKER